MRNQQVVRISGQQVPSEEHLVVVQPHLDDAVLSAYTLMKAAKKVTVIAVCAGVPEEETEPSEYDALTGSTSPQQRMRDRRQEDQRAMDTLGAQSIHLDFLDVPYRSAELARRATDVLGAQSERFDTTGGAGHMPGELTAEAIEQELRGVLPKDTTCIAVPVGLGTHPDHILTAAAGAALARDYQVIKFADYPYAASHGWPAWVSQIEEGLYLRPEATWAEALERLGKQTELEAVVVTLTKDEQENKLETFTNYATQFAATEEGPSRLVSHPARIQFEVFWRLQKRPS